MEMRGWKSRRGIGRAVLALTVALLMMLSGLTVPAAGGGAVYADSVDVSLGADTREVNPADAIMDLPHRSGETPDFFVAPDGNDTDGDGSKENPFATLKRAQLAVRGLLSAIDGVEGDIVVELAGGFYPTLETLTFDENDSGTAQHTVYYQAAEGGEPVISGGTALGNGVWEKADPALVPQAGELANEVYVTRLERDSKLRAIYVNGVRANMTVSGTLGNNSMISTQGVPTVSISRDGNEWAWQDTSGVQGGLIVNKEVGLSVNTKNPQNLEAERLGGARWARPFITFASIEPAPEGAADAFKDGFLLRYQMPYAIIAQSLSNNTNYRGGANQVLRNAFEYLNKRGDFYFDQAEELLYYIPREGENINEANVVIPELDMILEVRGSQPRTEDDDPTAKRAEYITFSGLRFSETDYKLFPLEGTYTWSDDGPAGGGKTMTTSSTGFASVQGCIMNTVYYNAAGGNQSINWHETLYRGYDIPAAAVRINGARNVRVLDGKIQNTGFNGIHLENDVKASEVTGNYIYATLSSAVVIGHPTHVYENDVAGVHESVVGNIATYAGVDKEKFASGTESAPENIYVTNNFLYENSFGFPGANALMSFYTTNMQILHNFSYRSSYGAFSIGWGWCEYDGYGYDAEGNRLSGSEGELKAGSPYAGTSEASFGRVVPLTTTSRNNKINFNRIEEACVIVNDSGSIYSLGRQGDPGNLPDGGDWFTIAQSDKALTNRPVTDETSNWHHSNWTNFTEMNYNFLNPNATGRRTTSNEWINGFHPDEGSTFIKFIGNVVQNKTGYNNNARAYEFNNWKRKSDMIAIDGYIDAPNDQNGGPRILNTLTIEPDQIWGTDGHDTVLYSGLEDEYTHMLLNTPELLIPDTELELASKVRIGKGEALNRRGLLSAEDTVWLAPEGTTEFAEGALMTKAAGDAKTINAPIAAGEYKLFIDYAEEGKPTAESKHTMYVGVAASAVNVSDGDNISVSGGSPFTLEIADGYIVTLNGERVENGYSISTAGNWTLVVSDELNPNAPTLTVEFTTVVTEADRMLIDHVTVAPGGEVRFAYDLNDADKVLFIKGVSSSEWIESDQSTKAAGNSLGMAAPKAPGTYRLYIAAYDADGDSYTQLSGSWAEIRVVDGTPHTPIDKVMLDNLIADADGLIATDFVTATWRTFSAALTGARSVSEAEDGITQASVDDAYIALRDAKAALVPVSGGGAVAAYGTPNILGDEVDELWETTQVIPIEKVVSGTKRANGYGKAMWDDEALYVLVHVEKPGQLFHETNDHQNDSTEIFVDERNLKTGGLDPNTGTGQYRINTNNARSATSRDDITSKVIIENNGEPDSEYYIQAKIPWRVIDPANVTEIGFDVQYNDCIAQGNRYGEIVYFGDGTGWQRVDGFGVLTLDAPADKTALVEALETAKSLDESAYTKDSWTGMAVAMKVVREVLALEDATRKEILNARSTLADAVAELEELSAVEADLILPASINAKSGGVVRFGYAPNDASKEIWLAPRDTENFAEGTGMTKVTGDALQITAPLDAGEYQLYVVMDGTVLSKSSAVVATDGSVDTAPAFTKDGLDLWLDANNGVTEEDGKVTGWQNRGGVAATLVPWSPPNGFHPNYTEDGKPDAIPTYGADEEDGYKYVEFSGRAMPLSADFKSYNGGNEMTMFLLALPTNTGENSTDQNGAMYFPETDGGNWSGINFGIATNRVNYRYGFAIGQNGNGRSQTVTADGLTSFATRFKSGEQIIRVNGQNQGSADTRTGTFAGNDSRLAIGYTFGGGQIASGYPFRGRIAQALIYDRALTDDEVTEVEAYLSYVAAGGGAVVDAGVDKALLAELSDYYKALGDADYYTTDSWDKFSDGLLSAISVIEDADATQAQVDEAFRSLLLAADELVRFDVTPTIPGASIVITGPETAESGKDVTVEYTISAENLENVSGIELEFEIDKNFYTGKEFIPNNLTFLGDGNNGSPIWWREDGDMLVGKVTLINEAGINGDTDIMKIVLSAAEDVLGTTWVKLNYVKLSFAGFPVPADVMTPGSSVKTEFVKHYSVYDVNTDGTVDLNDITFALIYFMLDKDAEEWETAKIADVNTDGVIDISDLVLILANYTVSYY